MSLSTKPKMLWMSVALILVFVGIVWNLNFTDNNHQQEYVRVSGSKPMDATVKVWANYWVHGEDCESYSYDMFGRKAHQGGKITKTFTPNDVERDDIYEFKVPYSSYINSKNCVVELQDIKVEAYNAFDPVGFAQLRIYPSGTNYNNKPIDINSNIEARDCRARYYDDLNKWSSDLACSFYINGKVKNKKMDLVVFNAYTVHFDFTQFNDNTVIYYDILPGDDYRSSPSDTLIGK